MLPAAIALAHQRQPGLVVGAQPDRTVPAGRTLRALYGEPLAVVCSVGHPLTRAPAAAATLLEDCLAEVAVRG